MSDFFYYGDQPAKGFSVLEQAVDWAKNSPNILAVLFLECSEISPQALALEEKIKTLGYDAIIISDKIEFKKITYHLRGWNENIPRMERKYDRPEWKLVVVVTKKKEA